MMVLFLTLLLQADENEIAWGKIKFTKVGEEGKEYDDALKLAEKNRQPLMIFFTCGCKPCQKFGETVFTEAKFVEQSQKFIRLFVKVKTCPKLAEKFEAAVCPHLVFLDSAGKEHKVYNKRAIILAKPEDWPKEIDAIVKELIEKKK